MKLPRSCFALLALLAPATLPAEDPSPPSAAPGAHAPAPAICFLYGHRELFPSALLCFTEDSRYLPRDPEQLGDPAGVISVRVTAPTDNCLVKVTLAETILFEESRVACRLPKAGRSYFVAPLIRYRADRLMAQKQPLANLVVSATVELDGQTTELATKIVVHGVGDALLRYHQRRPDGTYDADWQLGQRQALAAYVNENNPWIDQRITRVALDRKRVENFEGYQKDRAGVQAEVQAIYETLQALGFRYTNFPSASVVRTDETRSTAPTPEQLGGRTRSQAVRLIGDALESSQANRLETALIIASVLQKMAVDCALVTVDRSTVLAIYTARGRLPDSLIFLDPVKLGEGESFKAALASGQKLVERDRAHLIFDVTDDADAARLAEAQRGFWVIDIQAARDHGILPIPEVRRELRPL